MPIIQKEENLITTEKSQLYLPSGNECNVSFTCVFKYKAAIALQISEEVSKCNTQNTYPSLTISVLCPSKSKINSQKQTMKAFNIFRLFFILLQIATILNVCYLKFVSPIVKSFYCHL